MNSRLAIPDDIPTCVMLRGQTREYAISAEKLAAMGITAESWADDVRSGSLTGYVATDHESISERDQARLAVVPRLERSRTI
jgi:hypothetical protein